MTQFRKGLLIGALAITLVVGTVFGVGAVQVSNEPQPAVETSNTDSYVFGEYFVAVVELSEAGTKALSSQIGDVNVWIEQMVEKRTQDAVNELLVRALQDTSDAYLTAAQKEAFMAEMVKRKIYLVTYETIPADLVSQLILQMKVQ